MYEVEIKVPADVDTVRERLRRADADRVDARRQRDV
ncbi:class IV adenylate cyclase, partial [Halorubrum pallidum]